MKKNFVKVALVGVSACALVGCNNKEVAITADKAKNNEIIVMQDGKIQSVYKESFDKKYYKKDELKSFIEDDLKDFNNDNGTKVKLNSMDVRDNNAYVVMDYVSVDDYNTYNEYNVSTMKTDIAKDSKSVPDKLTVYGKDKTEHKSEALDKDKKVVIIQEKEKDIESDIPSESKVDLKVTVAGKIKYVSGAKKDDGNTATITTLKTPVVIVYE